MPVILKKPSSNLESPKCGMRGEYVQRCMHLVAKFLAYKKFKTFYAKF